MKGQSKAISRRRFLAVSATTGDHVRMNPPRDDEDLLEAAGPVNPEVTFLSVRHADGRPPALLGNYGLHFVGGQA